MVPNSLIPSLSQAADQALNLVLQNGSKAHGQKKPTGEVGFVAAVVLGGVPEIARVWRPILKSAGYSLNMSGVFCHQSPKATFDNSVGKSVSCELADLLVVFDEVDGSQHICRLASLIQAKMAKHNGGHTVSSPEELRQLDLLSHWPSFTLPKGFPSGGRDFTTCAHQGKPLDCARYGLITPPPNLAWNQQVPALNMPSGGDTLGSFLAQMAAGHIGYGREATGESDDWSRTVNDLMTITYSRAFNYLAGFRNPQTRGQTASFLVSPPFENCDLCQWYFPFCRHSLYGLPPSGGRPESPEDNQQNEGISILRIEISSSNSTEA